MTRRLMICLLFADFEGGLSSLMLYTESVRRATALLSSSPVRDACIVYHIVLKYNELLWDVGWPFVYAIG
jgi:hypothetical protein